MYHVIIEVRIRNDRLDELQSMANLLTGSGTPHPEGRKWNATTVAEILIAMEVDGELAKKGIDTDGAL